MLILVLSTRSRILILISLVNITIITCGLENLELGKTYLADRLRKDGTIIESALDHIYVSLDQNTKVTGKKMDTSSTDHLPIIAEIHIKV